MKKTFSGEDIIVANKQSKSTLRAVAGEVTRECEEVFYWPAYEYAMQKDVFENDGRHVKEEEVNYIIKSFLNFNMK